jgi:hypothetical protein
MYDTVFKFLLEDNALAKLLIGAIIQEEIVTLEFRPQERTSQIGHRGLRLLTVYRVDFAARVRNTAGEERLVLIELQKAKYPTDILRFRRYLGEQYRNPDNTCEIDLNAGKSPSKPVRQGLPLLTIYFLGHALEYTEAPVIHVKRHCTDLGTGTPLEKKEPFIESLTHDSYIIQIPKLHSPHRSEVEAMLQLFDQRRIHGDRHRLEIDESEIPERYRPLLRRLQRAVVEPEIADAMDVEDEVLAEMQDMERAVERERAEKEKERAEKERLLALLKQAGIDPEARS